MMKTDLSGLFRPSSIAIIGASQSALKVGAIVLKNIIVSGYNGKIYPINPNIDNIGGLKFYPSVEVLSEVPDLAVIAIPANLAIAELEKCGKVGIKNVVVFSAGFKEIGSEGEQLEKDLMAVADKYQLNILGPNCLGFAGTDPQLNVTFGQVVKNVGKLRLISQSGALAASLFDWCQTTTLGFKDFVTVGNKSILNENDILNYWLPELIKEEGPVGIYLESIANGRELIKVISQIAQNNPIFILKPGKSVAAASAMRSHTGAIAGEDKVFETAMIESGAIRCEELGDFFDLASALAWENAPTGPEVAVLSNAGGPAVLTTDTINGVGLKLAELSEETKNKLETNLPRIASIVNPVDILGDALADRFGQALEILLEEESVKSVIVVLTPQLMTQIEKTAEIIGQMALKYTKPILASFVGGNHTIEGQKILNQLKIPNYPFPERAIKVVAAMWSWQKWREKQTTASTVAQIQLDEDKIKKIIDEAKATTQSTLDNFQADKILTAINVPTPATGIVNSIEEANEFATKNSWPVVLKLSAVGLIHKADMGGVITNIKTYEQLEEAFSKLKLTEKNIQIQKQVESGIEVILGIKRDPSFGMVMLFGAGGRYAEIFDDHNLTLGPVTFDKAKDLVGRSKVSRLLSGFRDDSIYELDQLYEMMMCLSQLMDEYQEIAEIEINPLIITHRGIWGVDPKIIMEKLPVLIKSTNKKAKTISHEVLAGNFHYFIFESEELGNFEPGQFITVKVGPQTTRAYSIAGIMGTNRFELLVDISPGGIGSQYFEKLKEGEEIEFIGPTGRFVFNNDDSERSIFLATGSGITPFRAIIKSQLVEKQSTKPISLYFGLRNESDIIWQKEFEDLASKYSNFEFKLCLSRASENWTGIKGHITEIVAKDYPDCSKISAYLCGNTLMIAEAKRILLEAGANQRLIYQEKFD